MRIETAVVSVSDKSGVVELARSLTQQGVRILSTGGTAGVLREAGIPVTAVSDYTGFPEVLGGRVKTLHPRIYAGILARHDEAGDRSVLEAHGISPIGLVVVNLYPFSQTIQREDVTLGEAIEQIDIGGPAMVRAAAKNFRQVTVVVDPGDYTTLVAELRSNQGTTREETRLRLARKAFRHTAAYDLAITRYLEGREESPAALSSALCLDLVRVQSLRYGENPHQKAALFRPREKPPRGLVAARQHQGKELSFNNYVDLEAAWNLVCEFDQPFCAIIKHTNPCGAATAKSPGEAFSRALSTDPMSAFGSIVGFNRPVDAEAARRLKKLFVEAIIAPGYQAEALEILAAKKNLRVMEAATAGRDELDFKRIAGGFVVQEKDLLQSGSEPLKTVTKRAPEEDEINDLSFAWKICKHVKSNAIVFARGGQTVGVGAGQMSRVDSVFLAARKAQLSTRGCAMASDAFFPFRDGVDEAAGVGIRAIIQPGGSIRDQEVIDAADEHEIAMVFTGIRHFRH
ncbi:MAG: bifunctional phosphoribosylaminoimidazolecarboxamide formyltransferase/IMP cyclohydrolase [Acidobacteriota bacterium]